MTTYHVYLEVAPGDGCLAHVGELPGCCALARDEEAALAALPERIRQHRVWRHGHGLPAGGDDPIELVVKQVVHGLRPWSAFGAGALFSIDRRILDDHELELHLQLLAHARADLLHAVHAVPRGAYDDEIPGHPRTLRQTLTHLADTEEWLVSRLGRVVTVHEPDPVRRLVDVRSRTLEQLIRHDREDRDLVYVPTTRPSDDPEEMWTLRKLLRRLLEHELEHLADVQASLARWSYAGHE
jgi:hypothetical protein